MEAERERLYVGFTGSGKFRTAYSWLDVRMLDESFSLKDALESGKSGAHTSIRIRTRFMMY